jgi:RNA recognition motif-containing protein
MANNNGKSSLFIGDLAIFCSEREIEDAFSPYGEIQEIKIMRSEETSRNLSYGFIKYSSAQAAKRAMTELNGVILCGRPLRYDVTCKICLLRRSDCILSICYRIRWATYKSKVGSKEPKQDVLETSPVHVSFISYQVNMR